MSNTDEKELFIKLTRSPSWAFITEYGTEFIVNFDKSHPDALKGLAREAIQMLYHHYGCKEAGKFLESLNAATAAIYADKNP